LLLVSPIRRAVSPHARGRRPGCPADSQAGGAGGTGPRPPGPARAGRKRVSQVLRVAGPVGAPAIDCAGPLCYRAPPTAAAEWAISSVGERLLHTQEATGSKPVSPTIFFTRPPRVRRGRTLLPRLAGTRVSEKFGE